MCHIIGPGRILRFVLANGDCDRGDNVEFDPKGTSDIPMSFVCVPNSAQR